MEQKGVTIWFTGLSSSGKTTLSRALAARLRTAGLKIELLDGDEVRKDLSIGLGYSKEDRDANIKRIGYVASLLTRNGVAVIVAAISPYRETREFNRRRIGNLVEVYCRCPLDIAEGRDVKGLYKRARNGEIRCFTGIDAPYEEPLKPEVLVDTDRETISQSLDKVWRTLEESGYVPKGISTSTWKDYAIPTESS